MTADEMKQVDEMVARASSFNMAPRAHLIVRLALRFLTPEQYEAEVGAQQVALETEIDPESGLVPK
jgi:hypothetical protein